MKYRVSFTVTRFVDVEAKEGREALDKAQNGIDIGAFQERPAVWEVEEVKW